MTVSNFHMTSKGAAKLNDKSSSYEMHDFTYVVADEGKSNFHAFFDEHETWINHRDNGKSLNVDADMVKSLLPKTRNKA